MLRKFCQVDVDLFFQPVNQIFHLLNVLDLFQIVMQKDLHRFIEHFPGNTGHPEQLLLRTAKGNSRSFQDPGI